MPATGVRPPMRTLVLVRAIAPVAQKPPNSGAARFASPCAISSWFGSWRSSIMLSATVADSSDSIAPSRAMVNAGANSGPSSAKDTVGSANGGRPDGMPPKREPIVSTSSPSATAAPVPATSATTGPGTLRQRFGQSATSSTQAVPSATLCGLVVGSPAHSASTLAKNSAGSASMRSPKNSLTWDSRISTAMPLVKPLITEMGMKRIHVPSLAMPMASSITPAIIVQISRFATPYCTTMP